jgi:hypothetical protein
MLSLYLNVEELTVPHQTNENGAIEFVCRAGVKVLSRGSS